MTLTVVLMILMGFPWLLVVLCQIINGQWLFRQWLRKKRKGKK